MNDSKKKLLATLLLAFIFIDVSFSKPDLVSHTTSDNAISVYDAIPCNNHND